MLGASHEIFNDRNCGADGCGRCRPWAFVWQWMHRLWRSSWVSPCRAGTTSCTAWKPWASGKWKVRKRRTFSCVYLLIRENPVSVPPMNAPCPNPWSCLKGKAVGRIWYQPTVQPLACWMLSRSLSTMSARHAVWTTGWTQPGLAKVPS